jgi:hypothetical protein
MRPLIPLEVRSAVRNLDGDDGVPRKVQPFCGLVVIGSCDYLYIQSWATSQNQKLCDGGRMPRTIFNRI